MLWYSYSLESRTALGVDEAHGGLENSYVCLVCLGTYLRGLRSIYMYFSKYRFQLWGNKNSVSPVWMDVSMA